MSDSQALIRKINSDGSLSRAEKTRRIQDVMTARWKSHSTPTSADNDKAEEKESAASFYSEAQGILGCSHYMRGCKLQAPCCGKLYPCRLCHDDKESHKIDRYEVKKMMCMVCSQLQPVAQTCRTPTCEGRKMAFYFCNICNFFDNNPEAKIFHCSECRLCRRGNADDFVHCNTCGVCIAASAQDVHTCIEQSLHSDCPICHEFLFTSVRPVRFMQCGHPIHENCFWDWTQHHYICPVCSRSLGNQQIVFDRIEAHMDRMQMPVEYQGWRARVLCNDCLRYSEVAYHFFAHKCTHCSGYNTRLVNSWDDKSESAPAIVEDLDEEVEDDMMPMLPSPSLQRRRMSIVSEHYSDDSGSVEVSVQPEPQQRAVRHRRFSVPAGNSSTFEGWIPPPSDYDWQQRTSGDNPYVHMAQLLSTASDPVSHDIPAFVAGITLAPPVDYGRRVRSVSVESGQARHQARARDLLLGRLGRF